MLDFSNKRIVIFGNNLSGKSFLAKYICSKVRPNFVFDYHGEYNGINDNRYLPTYKDNFESMTQELDLVVNNVVIPEAKRGNIKLFVFDEASQYCLPKPSRLPQSIRNLNDNYRHYGNMGILFIGRRPSQINQDITELAHYKIFFRLGGRADSNYEDDLEQGLAAKVKALKPYHFVVVDEHGIAKTYAPVTA